MIKHIKLPFKLLWYRGNSFFFSSFIFISWRLITSQHCSGFCHTLTWISHGVTCIPHPNPPSHLPLHPIPLGLPSVPGPSNLTRSKNKRAEKNSSKLLCVIQCIRGKFVTNMSEVKRFVYLNLLYLWSS